MKAWFRCELVDSDPPHARQLVCVIDAADRETADKKCRAKFSALFRRLTTNKIQLSVEPTSAPSHIPEKAPRGHVTTDQIFTREQAP